MRAPEERATRLKVLDTTDAPVMPVRMPRHYAALVEEERRLLGRDGGPLFLVVHPPADRHDHAAPGEVVNYVEDFANMPDGLERVIVHRYPEKLLFFPTDLCVGYCQYCFRPDITAADDKVRSRNLDPEVIDAVVAYLRRTEVEEVIFSGGDPLTCRCADLERAVRAFRQVPSVRWIRFHTKGPIFSPKTVSDGFLDLCVAYDIRVVLHIVHPYEIPPAHAALERMRDRGIQMFNQFPLLRGINDHALVIKELGYQCARLGIQMLSMFIADPIFYSAPYRLRLDRVFAIADAIFLGSPAWISNMRVCLDTPIGKVRREHIVSYDSERDVYVFGRQGRTVEYHDFPAALDEETPLTSLLYRGADFVTV